MTEPSTDWLIANARDHGQILARLTSNDDLHENLDKHLAEINASLNQLRAEMQRRLPLWATFAFTGASALITGLTIKLQA